MTLEEVIAIAAEEGWRIRPPSLKAHPILYGGEIVGFYCPHAAGRGYVRVGPIYVLPEYRGRRLAEQAYASITTPVIAYIHAGNIASERLHERCGFERWYSLRGGTYWRRGVLRQPTKPIDPPGAPRPLTWRERAQKALERGDERGALRIASKHVRGPNGLAIGRAYEALVRPDFQRQLGRTPERLVADGMAVLRELLGA